VKQLSAIPSRLLSGQRGQFVRFCLVGVTNTALTVVITAINFVVTRVWVFGKIAALETAA
jgi:putative flippase GtrA